MGLGNSASLAKASMSQPCDAVCNKKEKHFFVWFSELFFLANSMGKVKLLADREERDAGSETVLSSVQLLCFHFFHPFSPQPNQECYHKDTVHLKTETGKYYVQTSTAFSSRVTKMGTFCL